MLPILLLPTLQLEIKRNQNKRSTTNQFQDNLPPTALSPSFLALRLPRLQAQPVLPPRVRPVLLQLPQPPTLPRPLSLILHKIQPALVLEDSSNPVNGTTSSSRDNVKDHFHCPMEPCHLNIVFMGDSLHASLVHFLRFHNTWIEPTDHPNMFIAQTHLSKCEVNAKWTNYYNQTMQKLAPYENCDCFRPPKAGPGAIVENRCFRDPTRNNTITQIQAFGKNALHGHWKDPVKAAREPLMALQQQEQGGNQSVTPVGSGIPPLGPMPAKLPDVWEGDWNHVIESHISQIKPNVLVMNAGKWPNNFHRPEVREQLLNATKKAGIPRVVWKTTTASQMGSYRKGERTADEAMCQMMECLCVSQWTKLLSLGFYQVLHHFKEPVCRIMNEQFLSFLGAPVWNPPPLPWSVLNIGDASAASLPSRQGL